MSNQSSRLGFVLVALMVLVAISFDSHPAAAVKFKEYYKGLPNYEESPPFVSRDPALHGQLASAIEAAVVSPKACATVKVDEHAPPFGSNLCRGSDVSLIKSHIAKMAPSLNPNHVALWKSDLNSDGEADLLISYLTLEKQTGTAFSDKYLTLWLLERGGKLYKVTHVGPFLDGYLHGIKPFGPFGKYKTVFVRFLSCTECHPITYLLAVNFGASNDGSPFEFTYSENHQDWGPNIEYELPGRGHTVDADVETRIPIAAESKGPHLLQKFAMKDSGKTEWWVFTCSGLKCDYQMFLGALPSHYERLWRNSSKL